MTRRELWLLAVEIIAVLAAFTLVLAGFSLFLIYYGTPDQSDYTIEVIGAYELIRRCSNCRSLWGPVPEDADNPPYIDSAEIVGEDVVRIGWDTRFIVCCQNITPEAEEQSLVYWVIDMENQQRHGPLSEEEYPALLMELGAAEPIRLLDTPRSSWDVSTFNKNIWNNGR